MVNSSREPSGAILNDFDFAATMVPGSLSPNQPGFEKVGTRPFMAVDLIQKELKRGFRHDLESAIWAMIWYCQKQSEWLDPSMNLRQTGQAKFVWADSTYRNKTRSAPESIRHGAEHLWRPLIELIWHWLDSFHLAREEPTDREVLDMVNRHIPCPKDLDTSWMNFRVQRSRLRRKDK